MPATSSVCSRLKPLPSRQSLKPPYGGPWNKSAAARGYSVWRGGLAGDVDDAARARATIRADRAAAPDGRLPARAPAVRRAAGAGPGAGDVPARLEVFRHVPGRHELPRVAVPHPAQRLGRPLAAAAPGAGADRAGRAG